MNLLINIQSDNDILLIGSLNGAQSINVCALDNVQNILEWGKKERTIHLNLDSVGEYL